MSAPHCPKCGGMMVYPWKDQWMVGCDDCGFQSCGDYFASRDDAVDLARRLVRRELAEQALAMRARGSYVRASRYDGSPFADWPALEVAMAAVSAGYVWLGTNPIRLPGEDA